MPVRLMLLAVSVFTAACFLREDASPPEPEALPQSDANVDHAQVSAANAMHFAQCALQTPECLAQSQLTGFWACPGNGGYDFAIGSDGRVELLNHNGAHGIGCITCDGSFEVVSDQDNLGNAWVNVSGNGSVTGAQLKLTWSACGARELEACRADPDLERSDTCTRS